MHCHVALTILYVLSLILGIVLLGDEFLLNLQIFGKSRRTVLGFSSHQVHSGGGCCMPHFDR